MAKQIFLSCFVVGAIFNVAAAFAPPQSNPRGVSALKAESGRRELLDNLVKTLGIGAIAAVTSTSQSNGSDYELLAKLKNPALETFKGKYKGQSFKPGKGMRDHEEELIAKLKNPALETFKGKYKGQSFKPGKGMRGHEEELIAKLKNPALETFKGKYKGQSFKPGKGMRDHEEELIAKLKNPALETFKGKYKGQSFKPGKGMRDHEDIVC